MKCCVCWMVSLLVVVTSALVGEENDAWSASRLPTGEEILRRSPKGVRFSNACARGEEVTLSAVGDVLLHDLPQIQAVRSPDRFTSLWRPVMDLLQRTDLTYANLEGTTAWGINRHGQTVPDPGFVFDDDVYSGLPFVNYHPSLLKDLLASGVDVVSSANNHSLDRGPLGVDRTIEALKAAGLPYTGTRARSDRSPQWHAITTARNIRVAWIACGFMNENRVTDPEHQSLQCYKDADLIEKLIRKIKRSREADAVIVTPHWGKQFQHVPVEKQIQHARRFLEAGAIAILGAHPHYIQPWEKIITRDGRETFVIYSLGNFVSGHRQLPRRATILLNLGLTKTPDGMVHINGARYTPLIMTRDKVGEQRELMVQAIERHPRRDDPASEAKTAWDLVVGILGKENIAPAGAPLETNPECE